AVREARAAGGEFAKSRRVGKLALTPQASVFLVVTLARRATLPTCQRLGGPPRPRPTRLPGHPLIATGIPSTIRCTPRRGIPLTAPGVHLRLGRAVPHGR